MLKNVKKNLSVRNPDIIYDIFSRKEKLFFPFCDHILFILLYSNNILCNNIFCYAKSNYLTNF